VTSKPRPEMARGVNGAQGSALLEVADLEAGYGMSRVLFRVNLRVQRGEVVALLGRNGAGKSTTLKAIMGILPPTAGRVFFDGRDMSRLPSHLIARAGIGYVPQDRRIFPDLTVRENLEVGRRVEIRGEPRWSVQRVCAVFPALGPLGDRRGESLSGGEQQMLAIARTLMGNPRVLLLDEPSEGLAPMVVQSLAAQVLQLKEEGVTIVLSEQNVRFTALVSDRAYVLEKGHVRHEGDMREISRDASILGKYLRI
jgi:branched-chain amino acid transport system ATP-binding protein